ncbi:MAG: SurA N-terminal domain-containing protein [Prevotella sp.]|nr:SurA N-terminal domain-containing protein [Prevotella sp.]
MAAIGKIRSWGPVLAIVIGLALFAFIAEEMFRSCESQSNERRQQVGEVLGEKINVQEYQSLVDEYQQVMKLTQGRDNFSEQELNQIKDQVWNTYVSNKVIEKEAKKLGLTVTDEEIKDILREGTNPMLLQTPFVNQQTKRFDVAALQRFQDEYKKAAQTSPQVVEQMKTIYDYWMFLEKTLRQQTLAVKYQTLLAGCLISNPISAKAMYEAQNVESDIILASVNYNTMEDSQVKVSDEDLKAAYNKDKEKYKQLEETRDIKYVEYQVVASEADRAELMKRMVDAANKLESGANPDEVVRKAQSQIAYLGVPVTRRGITYDIFQKVDSMAVGQTSQPFESKGDNTLNVVKLISKTQLPDSVEFRMIQVTGSTLDEARNRADSIYNAIKGGATFEAVAKIYGQTGEKQWMTTAQYEKAPSIDADSKSYLNALNTLPAGELKNLQFTSGNVVVQVTDRKAMTTKYDLAVVKHSIDFSKGTYSEAYNKFSQFVSENKTLEDVEKNASKFGFHVLEKGDMTVADHLVANINGTRDALKWIFEAKPGEVSPLYECGSNDRLLVIALEKVHPEGYRAFEDVRDQIGQQLVIDKKAEAIMDKMKNIKGVEFAETLGAKIDTVKQVTFAAPVFVQSTGASEPALSGAVAALAEGKFTPKPIKGNAGVYMFQVVSKKEREGAKFDAKEQEQMLRREAQQAASRFMQELYEKADVTDNRYLFF